MNADGERLARLAETIERLRSRMTQHREHIGDHETRTRVILIDPLLRSLGWDTKAPENVVHEHSVGRQRVDYALKNQGVIVAVLEAKALKSKLDDRRLVKYVGQHPNVPVIAFTNGDEWRFFLKSNEYERETVKVSSGERFETGFELHQRIGWPIVPPPPPPPPSNGKVLTKLRDKVKAGEFARGKKPTRVIFEGVPIELPKRTWKELYVAVAKHLVTTGRLQVNMIDVRESGRSVRSLVTADKESFKGAVDIGGGLWLQGNVSRIGAVDNSNFLLEVCDVDPATVRVYFDES